MRVGHRLLFLVLSCYSIDAFNTKGLNPSRRPIYESRIQGLEFCCLDSSRCIPTDLINDDFCDCDDGSDEFGTSACAGRHGDGASETLITFWCPNEGDVGLEIDRSRVNDGICDCCDGSDEVPSIALLPYRHSSHCNDTCYAARAERLKMEEALNKGRQKAKKLAEEGASTRQQWVMEMEQLTKEKNPIERQIEALRKQLSTLTDKKRAVESSDDAHMTKAVQTTVSSSSQVETPTWTVPPDLETVSDTGGQDQASVEGIEKGPDNSEYTKWMEMKKKDEARRDVLRDGDGGGDDGMAMMDGAINDARSEMDMGIQDEAERMDESETTTTTTDTLGDGFLVSWIQWSREWVKSQWKKQFGIDKKIAMVESQLIQLEASLRELTDKKMIYDKRLRTDFGRNHQFVPLMKKCFSKPYDKYVYEVCLLEGATQKEGSSSTNLGTYSGLVETQEDGTTVNDTVIMKFSDGTSCWNGPMRSFTVTMTCWPDTELLSVSETERCVYSATMHSPAACTITTTHDQEVAPGKGTSSGGGAADKTAEL